MASGRLRWHTVEEQEQQQPTLFPVEQLMGHHVGKGEYRGLEFLHVNAKKIINPVPEQSRMSFRYTINAYRGCSHACGYCYARPTHEYLDLNIGKDFETKIVVKVNAVERLRAELSAKSWSGDHITMGTNTDPYQKAEGKYHLTKGIIEVLTQFKNPFSILTKSSLILRDLDLLVVANECTDVGINFSIGTLDPEVWRKTEPGTPHPMRRVEALAKLTEAGIPCGVLVAPILPGISDSEEQLREVIEACKKAGAQFITGIPLHLRPGVKEHYFSFLQEQYPHLLRPYRRLYPRSYLSSRDQTEITDRFKKARNTKRTKD